MSVLVTGTVAKAALINIGSSPLVGLIVVLLLCGFAAFIWRKVFVPLLAKIIDEPWLGIASWAVYAILIIIALSRALLVIFGIDLFGSL